MNAVILERRRAHWHLVAMIASVVCVGCLGDARSLTDKQAGAQSGVSGTVSRAHTCPKRRTDRPCSAEPAEGVVLRVVDLAGKEIRSLVTDARGQYATPLAPGTYRIEANITGLGKDNQLPANIAVQRGENKVLDVCIETGGSKEQQAANTGMLVGRIMLGPISPLGFRTEPVARVQIVISSLESSEMNSVFSDDQGRYSIRLSPGQYRVEMPRLPPRARFTKDLPVTVTIVRGEETCREVLLDTGVR